MRRRDVFMTEGNAYGMAILRRFLLDDIVDTHIRPLLLGTFPVLRIRDGKITVHVHWETLYQDCGDIDKEIRLYHDSAKVVSTSVDVIVYHDAYDVDWGDSITTNGALMDITRMILTNARFVKVYFTHVYPKVHKSKGN